MTSRSNDNMDFKAIGTIKANSQFEQIINNSISYSISNDMESDDNNAKNTIIFTSPEEGIIRIAGEVFVIKVKATKHNTSKSTDGVIVSIIIVIIVIIIMCNNYYHKGFK